MNGLSLPQQESIDDELITDILQLQKITLQKGTATCQVCGDGISDGSPVTVYVFRPANAHTFQVGFVLCEEHHDEPQIRYTLNMRELLVTGRIGRCLDRATRSSSQVLVAPKPVAVSSEEATEATCKPQFQKTPNVEGDATLVVTGEQYASSEDETAENSEQLLEPADSIRPILEQMAENNDENQQSSEKEGVEEE